MAIHKIGVILINLGSPEEPTKRGVARFLREFLADGRVVEIPRLIWWLLLNGLVIPLRAKRVAEAYRSIWLPEGSPLAVYTRGLAEKVHASLETDDSCKVKADGSSKVKKVTWAMTYGGPSIATRIVELSAEGMDKILLIPLFPQYSSTTTGAVYDSVANLIKRERNVPDVYIVKDYHQHPAYIEALAQCTEEHWEKYGRNDRLLMSFHGIPEDYAAKGDPYPEHCQNTANALAKRLNLKESNWKISYQSRFGRQRWLQPYTSKTLQEWGEQGLPGVDVICPAFSADCLETLEEIDVENRDFFIDAGGKSFSMIPCLNIHPAHVALMEQIIKENTF